MPDNLKAYLFPGQGVLVTEICDYYSALKNKNAQKTEEYINTLQHALDEIKSGTDFNTTTILADQASPAWLRTDFVQPLIYTLSVLAFELMDNKSPDFVLGHSLGALSALTASGALNFQDGSRLVAARGKFMQQASDRTPSAMIAIIGLAEDKIKEIAAKTNTSIALSNAPTAFVIGAAREKIQEIEKQATETGARKTIILTNSGAFHTSFMQSAYEKIKEYFTKIEIKKPHIPVVTNITSSASTDPEQLKNDIIDSTINLFNWTAMIQYLITQKVNSYTEVGPGNSLSALARLNGVDRNLIIHAN